MALATRPSRTSSRWWATLQAALYRLQYLVGTIEGVRVRSPCAVDHLLRGVVALGGGGDLLLVGREVHARQELLELECLPAVPVAPNTP